MNYDDNRSSKAVMVFFSLCVVAAFFILTIQGCSNTCTDFGEYWSYKTLDGENLQIEALSCKAYYSDDSDSLYLSCFDVNGVGERLKVMVTQAIRLGTWNNCDNIR